MYDATTRREFLRRAIGVRGRGGANLGAVASENIVALCDIDRREYRKGWKL